MSLSRPARLRTVWWTLHRWTGIGLCVLLVPIAVSGALLVWHETLDAMINPARYAVSGSQIAQPPSAYLASARAALPSGPPPGGIRFPEHPGGPVLVIARTPRGEGTAQVLNLYLDPPTGRVLDVVDVRASLFGFLHRFHENLTVPEYSGRAVVGWAGVGMLILSLTGLWLWWPRGGAFRQGLRWRRAPQTTTNLHHLVGFWIAIPLAVVSLTGIYLSFPPQARSLMSSLAAMNPQPPRPGFGAVARETRLTVDAALAAALAAEPGASPAALFLPTSGGRGRARDAQRAGASQGADPKWRVQLRRPGDGGTVILLVDDHSGAVERLPDPLAGDRAARWMRTIHEGSRGGPLWQVAVFLTGVVPVVFAVTGVIMWLRGRRSRRALAQAVASGKLQAAE